MVIIIYYQMNMNGIFVDWLGKLFTDNDASYHDNNKAKKNISITPRKNCQSTIDMDYMNACVSLIRSMKHPKLLPSDVLVSSILYLIVKVESSSK